MSTLVSITLVIALVLSIIIPFGAYLIGEKNRGRFKNLSCTKLLLFLSEL